MTEEQVLRWQKRRDEAKQIEDPAARQAALDVVYDLKDDLQLDCQRKMSDRIKALVARDQQQAADLVALRLDVSELKKGFQEHDPVVRTVKDAQVKTQGAWLLLKIIGVTIAIFGSSAAGFWLGLARRAAGAE